MEQYQKMGSQQTGEKWRDFYQTPGYILDAVKNFYGGEFFDPCPVNPTFDGLSTVWQPNSFINPPFSDYKSWVTHGLKQSTPQLWICNHNHDTAWFRLLLDYSIAMVLLQKRVKFIDPLTGTPSASTAIGKCQTIILIDSHNSLISRERSRSRLYKSFKDLGTIAVDYSTTL